jgi:hypothetical protein
VILDPGSLTGRYGANSHLLFAKTPADFEINDIAAGVPPAFCYKSRPRFNSSACTSER